MDNIQPSRRSFLKTSAAASVAGAVAANMVVPQGVFAAASGTLKVGLVGCGGRGTGAAGQALNADKDTVLHAVGDLFEDRLTGSLAGLKKRFGERVTANKETSFVGFDAYKKVIDSGVDVVLLCTPPGFRPEQLRYAVEKGKHIFTEKPMATDVPGVRHCLETVKMAREKKLALVAGFCYRYSPQEREIFQRVHDGNIGQIVAVYGTYNTGALWSKPRQEGWTDMEWQCRNWLYFTWLSGDHIVEQAIHTIDKMAWAMKDEAPVSAIALGGRQSRVDPNYGHIFDHFSVVYEWKDGTKGFHTCRQQEGTAGDVSDWVYGTTGNARILPFNTAYTLDRTGQRTWKFNEERKADMYQVEHNELFASIRKGEPLNDGVRMMNSTMMGILGRMAAYTGQLVTWDKAMKSQEKLVPEKLEFGPLALPPVAIPGKTKIV